VALSGSFKQLPKEPQFQSIKERRPSGRRRQLYILYLLNDLLHHTKYHIEPSPTYSILTANLQSPLAELFGSVSAHSIEVYAKHNEKIQNLLDVWDSSGYYLTSYIVKLRETVANTAKLGYSTLDEQLKAGNGMGEDGIAEGIRDAPYIMPALHGDASVPFYDLPAGNILPHIMPNSATPINAQLVMPLQFIAGPADETLVTAVKDFLRSVESMEELYCEDEGTALDVDQLGQFVVRDEITGDIPKGDGYYGWSKAFCEKMKRRGDVVGDKSNNFTRDRSIDRSLSPRKRRYSDFGSSSSRSRSRSSSVRSRHDKRVRNGRDRSVSRSRSRSSSEEQKPYRSLRSRSPSVSRSSSYIPPPIYPPSQPSQSTDPRPLPRGRASGPSPPQPQPPFAHPFSPTFPIAGPGGLPIPPPPPPNYTGVWPPPPSPTRPSPNYAGYSQSASALPPPIGPRIHQNHGPPSFPQGPYNSFQSQTPPNTSSRGQQQPQQQSSPDGSYPYGGRGRAQVPFIPNAQNSRGRGFDQRGGWTR